MKFRKIFLILIILLLAISLFACTPKGNNTVTNGKKDAVPVLKDLVDYSKDAKYFRDFTKHTYVNTDQQRTLLANNIAERAQKDDLSIPLKIYVASQPDEIIDNMREAGLTLDEMKACVQYLVGQDNPEDIQSIVDNGTWQDNDGWSFFDDWDYYDKLRDRADATGENVDSDNSMRQRRKMMRQVFEIGLTGDAFARLVYEELGYAYTVTNAMYIDFVKDRTDLVDYAYEDYVMDELSFDTLVYFNAFNDFSKNVAKTVQLYGYYYDYNKKSYDSTTDAEFNKQLEFSHLEYYSPSQWKEYLQLQRDSYTEAYRYSYAFYKSFYTVHFDFQALIEKYDMQIFDLDPATPDERVTYSSEMKKGMEEGFEQQLIMSDLLYLYSLKEQAMTDYNNANTAYQQSKGVESIRNEERAEKEFLYNMEQLKIVDYLMDEMSNNELSKVLKYQIYSYSGDMIRNIQSERKDVVLDKVEQDKLVLNENYQTEFDRLNVSMGRTTAIVNQLKQTYSEARPSNQIQSAGGVAWDAIEGEVEAALKHDYDIYEDGEAKKEAFDNLIIKKKKVNADGSPYVEGEPDVLVREEYDTSHNISLFLNNHDKVLRYAIGQVEIKLYGSPKVQSGQTYNIAQNGNGIYVCGNDFVGRTMPDSAVPNSYSYEIDSFTFESGLTIPEGADDFGDALILSKSADRISMDHERYQESVSSALKRYIKYEFEGWYIDSELKFRVSEKEKIKYDLYLYPGYTVTVQSDPFPGQDP